MFFQTYIFPALALLSGFANAVPVSTSPKYVGAVVAVCGEGQFAIGSVVSLEDQRQLGLAVILDDMDRVLDNKQFASGDLRPTCDIYSGGLKVACAEGSFVPHGIFQANNDPIANRCRQSPGALSAEQSRIHGIRIQQCCV